MKIAFFNTKTYDRNMFDAINQTYHLEICYYETHLDEHSANLLNNEEIVCAFINDNLNREVLTQLSAQGVKLVALRSAGFNHVDMAAAKELNLPVVRVPAYSPYAIAEHAAGLLLSLNRRLHRAYNRVREGDFSINGLMGFDVHGKTVGIIGLGKIGQAFADIMLGFGANVLAYDKQENPDYADKGVKFVALDSLYQQSNIISLHCPLMPATQHMIDDAAIEKMQHGVTLLNTSRGGLLDTLAVIRGLKSKKIGLLGLDVYEEEEHLFFEDLSEDVIQDDTFARLLTFPNVMVTSHQAFFTREAVEHIADTTLSNIAQFVNGEALPNQVPFN